MTIWCDFCKRHVTLPCSVHHSSMDMRTCKRFRSTKGASKARRDHINAEIRNMRTLLPIPHEDQERLSYLHSMAAICTYIRKSAFFQGFPERKRPGSSLPYETFLQAMHGFILVVTAQGKLVYVSENVTEYLGHTMVDVLQGDTLYDMIECHDVDTVKSHLETDDKSSTERSFICHMHTPKAFKLQNGNCCSMLVRGCFQSASRSSLASISATFNPEEHLFVALCTPTVDRLYSADAADFSLSFSSIHKPDMSFIHISDSVFYFLGYPVEEMCGRSWYSLLHPEDLQRTADSHKSLVQASEGSGVEMVLRFQRKDLSWAWVYIRAMNTSNCQSISCTNYIITDTEASFLMKKINGEASWPAAEANSCHAQASQMPQNQSCSPAKGLKRRRRSESQSEAPGAKTRRESERDVHYVTGASSSRADGSPVTMGDSPLLFTPPYSPASSSPQRGDDLGSAFLTEVRGCADQSASSPGSSPSHRPFPDGGPVSHPPPAFHSLSAASEQPFHRGVARALPTDLHLSPNYEFQACAADARLVPDLLSVPDMCESPDDCTLHPGDFALFEQPQGGSTFQLHHVPHGPSTLHAGLLTPTPSPTSQDSFEYNDREHVEISILAQQISSLANSFDMYSAPSRSQSTAEPAGAVLPSPRDWPKCFPLSTALPFKPELVLDDGVIDSILKDLDMDAGKSSILFPGGGSQSARRGRSCEETTPHPGGPGLASHALTEPLLTERFTEADTTMDSFTLRVGSQDQNTGLYQLNHYMHCSLQQDGLLEEALY